MVRFASQPKKSILAKNRLISLYLIYYIKPFFEGKLGPANGAFKRTPKVIRSFEYLRRFEKEWMARNKMPHERAKKIPDAIGEKDIVLKILPHKGSS